MKRRRNLYDSVSMEDIIRVYRRQIRVNTKNKYKIKRFEDFYSINISRVKKTFEDADIIYVIHAPAYICIYRIIKRFIKRKLGIEKGKKESFISLISLLYWVFRYNTHEFPKLLLVLDEYSEKVIHLQYKNLLNQISI